MNKEIARVGDIVEYNGYIPDYINEHDIAFIKSRLIIGKSYIIIGSRCSINPSTPWFKIRTNKQEEVWTPIESLDVSIKEKYGLK